MHIKLNFVSFFILHIWSEWNSNYLSILNIKIYVYCVCMNKIIWKLNNSMQISAYSDFFDINLNGNDFWEIFNTKLKWFWKLVLLCEVTLKIGFVFCSIKHLASHNSQKCGNVLLLCVLGSPDRKKKEGRGRGKLDSRTMTIITMMTMINEFSAHIVIV